MAKHIGTLKVVSPQTNKQSYQTNTIKPPIHQQRKSNKKRLIDFFFFGVVSLISQKYFFWLIFYIPGGDGFCESISWNYGNLSVVLGFEVFNGSF